MVLSQILRSVNKNAAKTKNVDKEYAKQIDFKGLKFPVHKRDYAKREKQNNIFINVFGYDDETPYSIYTLNQVTNILTNQTKHHDKKHFCQYCLQYFSSVSVKRLTRNYSYNISFTS